MVSPRCRERGHPASQRCTIPWSSRAHIREGSMSHLVICSLLFAFSLLATTPATAGDGRNDRTVTVMTRNLYFGADLAPAIGARTVPELIGAVTHIFGVVQAS